MENFCCLNKFVYPCNAQNSNFYNSIMCFFDLFVVKVVKRHFRLNFVTSRWVQANIDFHLMKLTIHYGVACGNLTVLIDQLKGQHSNILECWRL